ncbi:MAG TPA: DNA topoisomerase IB [Actinomycetota bacterium]|jgi:DNA topoisomerase-1
MMIDREVTRVAGLRYVTDQSPGIRRRRAGSGFVYLNGGSRAIRDTETLARIRSLAVPPAWSDVWICPHPNGHLQATGRDARGRKQYRYHPRWRQVRDEAKFDQLLEFGTALPAIRRRIRRDLRREGLPREKVLATVVSLLDTTLIRIGNDEYARDNGSFGLTTMRGRHVDIAGSTVRFEFTGKSGVRHEVDVRDPRVASVIRRCRDLPGYELFRYQEDGEARSVDAADVNAYLREITGLELTSKDFRTWHGTVLAVAALRESGIAPSATARKRRTVSAIQSVAERLGNTPAVCRACYVHPEVVQAYLDRDAGWDTISRPRRKAPGLSQDETALLAFLRRSRRGQRPGHLSRASA